MKLSMTGESVTEVERYVADAYIDQVETGCEAIAGELRKAVNADERKAAIQKWNDFEIRAGAQLLSRLQALRDIARTGPLEVTVGLEK